MSREHLSALVTFFGRAKYIYTEATLDLMIAIGEGCSETKMEPIVHPMRIIVVFCF